MSEPIYFDEELTKQWRFAFEQARMIGRGILIGSRIK